MYNYTVYALRTYNRLTTDVPFVQLAVDLKLQLIIKQWGLHWANCGLCGFAVAL